MYCHMNVDNLVKYVRLFVSFQYSFFLLPWNRHAFTGDKAQFRGDTKCIAINALGADIAPTIATAITATTFGRGRATIAPLYGIGKVPENS